MEENEPLEEELEDAVLESEIIETGDELDENPPEPKKGTRAAALSQNQHKALRMLLNGKTTKEVADECGVSTLTIRTWRKLRTFAKLYRKEINAATKVAMSILQANSTEAAQTLVDMIHSKDFGKGQYNACKAILDYSLQFASLEELSKQVEELKAQSQRKI